jgi:signal transduction histidine kinase/CheY-like chemotaxis protein
MSPKSEQVERELLAIGFRAYPRGLLNGFVFACLTIWLVWPRMPHQLLGGWFAGFATIAMCRLAIARAFAATAPGAIDTRLWKRRAAFSYGATGFAWGLLACCAIHFAPGVHIFVLWVGFLIALFGVLQAQSTGALPIIFRSYFLSATIPLVVVSIIEPGQFYWLRLAAEASIITICLLAGRSGNANAAASVAMRFENMELLQKLTEQKEELARANSAKTRFLAAASHDLRQPMQAMVLLVESLQERVQEPATQRIVDNIRSSVVGMSALLNEILDISKFDAGTVKPQRASFPVSDVLDRMRSSFTEPAQRQGLVLRIRPCAAVIETDPILLARIVANFVDNALRYTARGGSVLVGCRRRANGMLIEVWDNGMGIDAAQLGEIFREFYQVENPQRDRGQGLGLGLAIVERTAKLLDHPIAVRSRPDRGSVFSILVPHGDPAQVRAAERARAAEMLTGCCVLVVEDDREIRAAMSVLLEGWGCHVVAAGSAEEAETLLAHGAPAPDAILADYRLGGAENGMQFLRRLAARYPGAAPVLISGDIAPEVLKEAEMSRIPMLHKPLRPARLRAMLGSIWRERSALAAE